MIDVTEQKPDYVIKAEEEAEAAKKKLKGKIQQAKKEARKRDDRNKYMLGGIVRKFYPDIVRFEQLEAERILKVALESEPFKNEVRVVENEWNRSQRHSNFQQPNKPVESEKPTEADGE